MASVIKLNVVNIIYALYSIYILILDLIFIVHIRKSRLFLNENRILSKIIYGVTL